VLWLRDHDIDISCIRLRPYENGGVRLVDVQQIIPLPEAIDYQVQIREKEQEGRRKKGERAEERLRFWTGLIAVARSRQTRHANIKPGKNQWLRASSGIRRLFLDYVVLQQHGSVELYIDRGEKAENKRIFDHLHSQREAVEKSFGNKLSWERLDEGQASRIKFVVEGGGYGTPEARWPELQEAMVTAMTKLETALKPALDSLKM